MIRPQLMQVLLQMIVCWYVFFVDRKTYISFNLTWSSKTCSAYSALPATHLKCRWDIQVSHVKYINNFPKKRGLQSSQILDEPLDLSVKRKVSSVRKKLILSRSPPSPDLAKSAIASFNSLTSVVHTKKYHSGLQRSGSRRYCELFTEIGLTF